MNTLSLRLFFYVSAVLFALAGIGSLPPGVVVSDGFGAALYCLFIVAAARFAWKRSAFWAVLAGLFAIALAGWWLLGTVCQPKVAPCIRELFRCP
jgi:hypothetical protein